MMYDVMIISPEISDREDIDLEESMEFIIHKPSGEDCPHLIWDGHISRCSVHDKKWFKGTPCYKFTQIERGDTDCRMGKYRLCEKIFFKR